MITDPDERLEAAEACAEMWENKVRQLEALMEMLEKDRDYYKNKYVTLIEHFNKTIAAMRLEGE